MTHYHHIIREFALTNASDAPQQPFLSYKSVNGNDIVCAMWKNCNSRYFEVYKGIMVAKQQIRRLHTPHADLCYFYTVREYGRIT